METIIKVALGAALGAMGGFVIGRAKTCSGESCRVRASLVYSVVAGAIFGAAAMYAFLRR